MGTIEAKSSRPLGCSSLLWGELYPFYGRTARKAVSRMTISHVNRTRSKRVPKAWQDCRTKPQRARAAKRDKRVIDHRESRLLTSVREGRFFIGVDVVEALG